jgi:hypothetical protein
MCRDVPENAQVGENRLNSRQEKRMTLSAFRAESSDTPKGGEQYLAPAECRLN